jgi:protein O-GlcNAc transferase
MPTKEEYFGKGLTLYGQNKHEEAITELKKALELDPSFADAHLAIGHALHKLKRLPEAVEAIKKAIEINPQDPMYHTSLSTVYRDMGRIPDAEEEMAISFQFQRSY